MRVRNFKVLAKHFDVVNRLAKVLADVLFHRQDRLLTRRVFQALWQLRQQKVAVWVRERQQLEFEVNLDLSARSSLPLHAALLVLFSQESRL